MNFNDHSKLEGSHAYLGASNYHWINYDTEKMRATFSNHLATLRGTRLHEFAKQCILLKQKLPNPRSPKTLNLYVNDAIGYNMQPEQILFYSLNCYGTADAICFRNNVLRIHDLKTGITRVHMEQLEIYAALFCLEYKIKPSNITIELRIYKQDEVTCLCPTAECIEVIMDKIIKFDGLMNQIKLEEGN